MRPRLNAAYPPRQPIEELLEELAPVDVADVRDVLVLQLVDHDERSDEPLVAGQEGKAALLPVGEGDGRTRSQARIDAVTRNSGSRKFGNRARKSSFSVTRKLHLTDGTEEEEPEHQPLGSATAFRYATTTIATYVTQSVTLSSGW